MTWNRNRLTEKLGIDYPIIQGPLGGLSSQRLTAAVSNLSTCTEVSVFLNSLVEEVSEIAGPLTEWSAKRREKK